MEPSTYLEHLHEDGEALSAAAKSDPAAEVGSCPGWDMTDLVAHTGGVHEWVDQIVRSKTQTYLKRTTQTPDGAAATIAWYDERRHALLATLSATDPDEPVWNWRDRGPAPARFWFRRMAQETTIHRWDSQNAASPGVATPIVPGLAIDGIDEYLGFVAMWLANQPVAGLAGSLHLHASDAEGEWTLELRPDGLEHSREHRKSDAAIRGPVSDLYLWMLNRLPADDPSLQRFGDGALVAAWAELRF